MFLPYARIKEKLLSEKRIIAGLSLAILLYILPFLKIYMTHDFIYPVGWDSAFYVEEAQKFQEEGLLTYLKIHNYPNLYVIIIGILSYVFGSYIVEIIVPITLGITFMLLNLKIARKLNFAPEQQILLALFVATSPNFIRISADLHRQLLILNFVYLAFIVASEKKNKSYKTSIPLFLILVLAAITQVETFVVLFLTLTLYSIVQKDKNIFLTLLILTLLILPFGIYYAPIYLSSLVYQIPPFNVDVAILYSGGTLFPLTLIGFLHMLLKIMKKTDMEQTNKITNLIMLYSLILIANLTILLLTSFPFPLERILLVTPIPIFIAHSINPISTILKEEKFRKLEKLKKYTSKKSVRTILFTTLICISIYQAYSFYPCHYKYFIPEGALSKLFYLKNSNLLEKTPIFLIKNITFTSIIDSHILRRYIRTTVGQHLAYLGNINLLLNLTPPSENLSTLYTNEIYLQIAEDFYEELTTFIKDKSDFNNYTIVIIQELYNDVVPPEYSEFEVKEGIYLINPNHNNSTIH